MGAGREPLTPPARDALFFNAATGLEHAGTAEAIYEAHGLIAAIVARLEASDQAWQIEDGDRKVGLLRHSVTRTTEREGAEIELRVGKRTWTLTLAVTARGWVALTFASGEQAIHAFAERQYEEVELWPANHPATPWSIAPGRMGKDFNWISLTVEGWPQVGNVSRTGVLNLYETDGGITSS